MPWAAIGAAALSAAGSAGSSAMSYYFDRKLQERAFNQQDYLVKNQHQFEVADLRAAGLNPILSANNGGGSGGGGGSAPSVQSPDIGASAREGYLAAKQAEKIKEETEMAKSISAKSQAEEDSIRQSMDQQILNGLVDRDLSSANAEYYRAQAALADIDAQTRGYEKIGEILKTALAGGASIGFLWNLFRGRTTIGQKIGDSRVRMDPPRGGKPGGSSPRSPNRGSGPKSPTGRIPGGGYSARANRTMGSPRLSSGRVYNVPLYGGGNPLSSYRLRP